MCNNKIWWRVNGLFMIALLYLPLATSALAFSSFDENTAISPLLDLTLQHYGTQKDLYAEGEGEGEAGSPFLTWEQYGVLGGVVALAFGILWLAEEPPSPCMVATAAYGTPLSGKLTILRLFRDRILLSTAAGTAFVDVYYRLGMGAADFIAEHSWAALLVRVGLLPLLAIASAVLLFPVATVITSFALLLLCALFVLYWVMRRRSLHALVAQDNLSH